jgi:hypothetical protein
MANKIPGALERRHLLERERSESQALRTAEAYREQGRSLEALDFLVLAGATDRIDALRGEALESGDVFLLRQVATATESPVSHDEWQALAASAASAGKDRYAAEARRQTARGED